MNIATAIVAIIGLLTIAISIINNTYAQTQQAAELPKGFKPITGITHFSVSENKTHINIDWGNSTSGYSMFILKQQGNQSK